MLEAVASCCRLPVEPAPAPKPAVVITGIPKEQAQLLAQSGFVDADPGGFGVRSANKESQLRFHLQVRADAKFWRDWSRLWRIARPKSEYGSDNRLQCDAGLAVHVP
jgi:hypothetical protein